MQHLFQMVNDAFAFIVPITDTLWSFPTNLEWYSSIPILGDFSLAILLLIGLGLYLTIDNRFIQIRHFKRGLKVLFSKKKTKDGLSPMTAFLLSSAMRVGPGNIVGVTGAITIGGPGALFWMWLSAFLGMATAYVESTLAQIFKEKKDDQFVGGMAFYGKKALGNHRSVLVVISVLLVLYAVLCQPVQVFYIFTSVSSMAEAMFHVQYGRDSVLYYVVAAVVIIGSFFIIFGGIKRVTKITDVLVPVMGCIYMLLVVIIALCNIHHFPQFVSSVVVGAFKPDAIFGGLFGVALVQGMKRGLMSNEAGMGTVTMFAATSENEHPCEQGAVQSIGVFLDTIIICTMTGFVVVLAQLWTGEAGVDWNTIKISGIGTFLESITYLFPGTFLDDAIRFVVAFSYGLFSYTTLIGQVSLAEISANGIRKDRRFINAIRLASTLFAIPFGTLAVLAGLELGNIWYLSDFLNIAVVYINIPLLIVGYKYARRAIRHFEKSGGGEFTSETIGMEAEYWDQRARELKQSK
ncbi:alanine:cation symporter family protein [Oscillibacter sp. MSJ-2]|uniref:Alanine:cation symporter family protein n=1 Tax=Dysosmobacter acutus TaxID=2841504 RepID=A0ABS6F8I9_9FIRM|nr:amino acid carrier protein [Dysosmobacter acutus]MBU5625675.1 alanine:cation symporter family protein [Dysosmobacter acutus]